MQCVMVQCKDGKNGIRFFFSFSFFFSQANQVCNHKNTVETGFLKANSQTVHLFEMSNAYQQ